MDFSFSELNFNSVETLPGSSPRTGTIGYIDVLDAQRRYFDAETGLSNAVRDEYLALISLYKSLGGGWSATPK